MIGALQDRAEPWRHLEQPLGSLRVRGPAPVGKHLLRCLGGSHEDAGRAVIEVVKRAVRDSEIGVLRPAATIEPEQQIFLYDRSAGPQHLPDARRDDGPGLRPDLGGGPAKATRVLGAERGDGCVIVDGDELRAPPDGGRHGEGKAGVDHRLQPFGPTVAPSQ